MKVGKIFRNKKNPEQEVWETEHGQVICDECTDYSGWIARFKIAGKEYRGYGRTPQDAYDMAVQVSFE